MAALVEVIIQVLRTLPLCLSKAMMLAFCWICCNYHSIYVACLLLPELKDWQKWRDLVSLWSTSCQRMMMTMIMMSCMTNKCLTSVFNSLRHVACLDCFCCMCCLQLPFLHHGVNRQCQACLEAPIALLVETFISWAHRTRMIFCHGYIPVLCWSCAGILQSLFSQVLFSYLRCLFTYINLLVLLAF